jgi:basic membrane protein A
VDTDWYISAPEFKSTYLTSVMKNMDVAVFDAVKAVQDGTYQSGTYVGTLENGGVDIAPYHDYDSQVPQSVKDEVAQVKQDLISGKITVDDALAGKAPMLAPAEAMAKLKVGEVTDVGGIDDKSFNATAWKGVQDAIDKLGVDGKYLESQQQTDYAKNIQEFVQQKYDLIITVGFLLGDATQQFAANNPDTKFAIVDFAYDPKDVPNNNILGLTFSTDQAAFLAGYVAAGASTTGKVGTFGGIKIPTVTIFMKGFEAGVKYYNQQHNAQVEVLGWDTATDEGLFTGNFESTDDGRRFAESLFDEGVDTVMPVAGPVGLGSAAAALERGLKIVGVDTDWYISAPEFKSTYLTSVMKNMDVAVFDAVKAVQDGTYQSGTYVGTLENGGVDIAPYHDYDSQVPQSVKDEVAQVKQDLISGKINIDDVLAGQ